MLRRGLLVDHDIRAALRSGDLVVCDLDESLVRPAAVSLRLGHEAYVLSSRGLVDVSDAGTYPDLVPRVSDESGRFILRPREVLLARTYERIGLSERLAGLLDGTSDWARLGVSIVLAHQVSPGYGMPGGAPLSLEIVSRLEHEILLKPGMRVANLLLVRGRRAQRSYCEMPAHHSDPTWSIGSRLSEAEAAGGYNLRPFDREQVRGSWKGGH